MENIFSENKYSEEGHKVLTLIPGLFGDADELLMKKAESFFLSKGYSVLILNPYNKFDSVNVTFDQMLKTIKDTFNDLFYQHYKIIPIGHSFGALLVLLFLKKEKTHEYFNRYVMWDPTLLPVPKGAADEIFDFQNNQIFLKQEGGDVLINETFFNELTNTVVDKLDLPPSQYASVIFAEKGAHNHYYRDYKKMMPKNTKFVVVDNADHVFSGEKNQRDLFEKTLSFLENQKEINIAL